MLRILGAVMVLGCVLAAQQPTPVPGQNTAQQGSSERSPAAVPGDELAQMQLDLDRMDSLLNNINSEIEFLHDQNLQILLRTNSQMWTLLIRDMRKHLAREQRCSQGTQPSAPTSSGQKPH